MSHQDGISETVKVEVKTESLDYVIKKEIKTELQEVNGKSHGFICPTCKAHFLYDEYFIEHVREHREDISDKLEDATEESDSEHVMTLGDFHYTGSEAEFVDYSDQQQSISRGKLEDATEESDSEHVMTLGDFHYTDSEAEFADYSDQQQSISRDKQEDATEESDSEFNMTLADYGAEFVDYSYQQQSISRGERSVRGESESLSINPSNDTLSIGKKRKRKPCILTCTALLALQAELKTEYVTVKPKQIITAFLDEKGVKVCKRVEKLASTAITEYRRKLRKVEKSKGELSLPPEDDPVFNFSKHTTPNILLGPTKPYAELTRQGRDIRIRNFSKNITNQLVEKYGNGDGKLFGSEEDVFAVVFAEHLLRTDIIL
ncbi:uncharacterized protein LOC134819921 isoform X1 [Bolinopsis microptera]|uniref:uncharacterized protein LOC134819921 isoform X1 n=1 Tax=Bolinopsis microptera TaxID=2820187 RepID=UPI0030798264